MTVLSAGQTASWLLLLLAVCLVTSCTQAERVTATTNYGFGPLWIEYNAEGDTLQRCDNVTINLGGGFGPYYLGELMRERSICAV